MLDSKKLRFIKEQEASGLLSSLGMKILIFSKYLQQLTYSFKDIK